MKEHKYNNTVIQINDVEHGKRVIEWWKEQGVDTRNLNGTLVGWYYGLIGGGFNNVQNLPFLPTIIELPESNPDIPQDLIGRKVSTTTKTLFNYLSEELGITVLASQIHDIERIVLGNQIEPIKKVTMQQVEEAFFLR